MPIRRPIAVLPLLWPAAAFAHAGGGVGVGSGFLLGLAHPVGGADHFLAMIAGGMWAATFAGRAVWALPVGFVGAMALGGAAGTFGLAVPGTEPVILASVILLGAALALAIRPPLAASLAAVALFGFAHGTAHGLEAPAGASLGHAAGLLCATAALHAAGVLATRALVGVGARLGRGLIGTATALAGLAMAVAP